MAYRITTTDGREWTGVYDTEDEAAQALAEALGWDEIVLSDSYAVDGDAEGTTTDAVSAYRSQAECDADIDGAFAPRITEVR